MSRSVLTVIVFCFLVVLASSSPTVIGQERGVLPPAPVPAQIFTAKNVFISNGGLDGIAFETFRKLGDRSTVQGWQRRTEKEPPV